MLLALVALPFVRDEYAAVLATDILIAALFAASLQFLIGDRRHDVVRPCRVFRRRRVRGRAGGQGRLADARGARARAGRRAGSRRVVFGWFCVRLSGVYLAMLTLAFAQIVWSIAFQWDSVTGGSNGLVGIWPRGVARQPHRVLLASRWRVVALAAFAL